MSSRKRSNKAMHELCGEIYEDDGIDPRRDKCTYQRPGASDRKTQQLCKQVMRTLIMTWGDLHLDACHSLEILSVTPAPDASRLLVTLRPLASHNEGDSSAALAQLEQVKKFLRMEVTAALTHKRSPELAFRIIPCDPERNEQWPLP